MFTQLLSPFLTLELNSLPLERVVGCNLRWETTDQKEILMLLGRDLLKHFLVIYNGKRSDINIAY